MGKSNDQPKPDESYLSGVDPELLAHSLITILIKNTSLQPALMQDALKAWRQRFMFHGEAITLIDVLVENGHLERYKVPALIKAAEYALKRREDKLFGKRAFRKGLITQTQMDDALAFQKQLFKALYEVKRLERILVDDGFLSAEDAREIWEEYDSAKDKRRGVARPASLQRAAKSLGIDIGTVGAEPEAAKARSEQGAAVAEADADDDDVDDDLFAPVGGHASGGVPNDDSAMEVGTSKAAPPDAAPLAKTQSATQASQAEPQRSGEQTGSGDDDSFSAESEDRELSDSIEELDLSNDFEPRDHDDTNGA